MAHAHRGDKKASDPVWIPWKCSYRLLGTEPKSSLRATSALNHSAISPASDCQLLLNKTVYSSRDSAIEDTQLLLSHGVRWENCGSLIALL